MFHLLPRASLKNSNPHIIPKFQNQKLNQQAFPDRFPESIHVGFPDRFSRKHQQATTSCPRMCIDDGRVVSNFVAQALRKEPLTVYGDGKPTRSFQFVSDLGDVNDICLKTMRRVQETLANSGKLDTFDQEPMSAPAALTMKQKRLTFAWLDGEAQQCMHGPKCKLGNFCTTGRRLQEVNVFGSLILPGELLKRHFPSRTM